MLLLERFTPKSQASRPNRFLSPLSFMQSHIYDTLIFAFSSPDMIMACAIANVNPQDVVVYPIDIAGALILDLHF